MAYYQTSGSSQFEAWKFNFVVKDMVMQKIEIKNDSNNLSKILIILIDRNFYLWDINQLIERWNRPVERIPRGEHCFVVCKNSDCWLDEMKWYEHYIQSRTDELNPRDPTCCSQVPGFSVSGWKIFPREAVC